MSLKPVVLDRYVLAFDKAGFFKALAERGHKTRIAVGRPGPEKRDHWRRLLLRSRGERPCAAHANSDNEFASFHVPPQRAETAAMKLRRGRSNQEIATGGTGFKADLARQQLRGLYVSLGSTTDIPRCLRHVCSTPESGHSSAQL
jgi:hypothetical protein